MIQEAEIIVEEINQEKYKYLIKHGIDPLVAKLLYRRGITDIDEVNLFLNGTLENLDDAGKFRDIEKVYNLINESIENEENIYIFGDYDVDGITSTAIMYLTLKDLGANVYYRLPNRLREGYGMTESAIEELYRKGCNLIITVDNGITCHKEIALARKLGMKTIIIDHHTPSKTIPDADVIINPHIEGEIYPYTDFAGCGLAFKVSCYLYEKFGFGLEEGYKNVDLAAIGTIADVVPLTGENRIITKEGLSFINDPEYDRVGIIALMFVLEIQHGTLTSMEVGYKIAPSLNAPGRLLEEGAQKALDLLLCEDEFEAINIAMELKYINEERKSITQNYMIKAEEYIEANNLLQDKVLVIFIPDIPEGVVGLVAGKITEKYHRPTIVFSEGLYSYKASARSTEVFNLYEALCACDDLLEKYGGHAQAAGMSINKSKEKLQKLRKRINEYADSILSDKDLTKKIYIDEVLTLEDISFDLVEKLSVLEPFGEKNPKPIFHIKNYKTVLKNNNGEWLPYSYIGEQKNHLKLYGENVDAIGFDMVKKFEAIGKPRRLDVVFTLGVNNFMGKQYLQLEMLDFMPAEIKENKETDLMLAMKEALLHLD